MRRTLSITFLVATLLGAAAGTSTRYEATPESRFWIDGTATTGRWTCEADAVSGYGLVGDARELAAEVTVPVRAFDCGSAPMNRDLYRALVADTHPAIQFVLERVETLDNESQPGTWVRVRTTGMLQLAGASRRITLVATGRRLPAGRVALQGHQSLRMSDFGVEPPSHAFGLVRAHDAIVVRFDLVAEAR